MTKACSLMLFAALAAPAPGGAQQPSPLPSKAMAQALTDALPRANKCRSSDPAEVVVCGRSQQPYRIDPHVLAATRAAEAPPPKPELDASRQTACVGPDCGGGTIPLVGMALAALKAAELAAKGDDWREAFRTHPDQYRLYEGSKAREKSGSIAIGISAGNKAPPR